jgi:hypothetical protein
MTQAEKDSYKAIMADPAVPQIDKVKNLIKCMLERPDSGTADSLPELADILSVFVPGV